MCSIKSMKNKAKKGIQMFLYGMIIIILNIGIYVVILYIFISINDFSKFIYFFVLLFIFSRKYVLKSKVTFLSKLSLIYCLFKVLSSNSVHLHFLNLIIIPLSEREFLNFPFSKLFGKILSWSWFSINILHNEHTVLDYLQ